MNAAVLDALRKTPLYAPAQRCYWLAVRLRTVAAGGSLKPCTVKTHGHGNRIEYLKTRAMKNASIKLDGNDNVIEFHPDAWVDEINIRVAGDGNRIIIGAATIVATGVEVSGNGNVISIADQCLAQNAGIVCEDDGNTVTILDGTVVAGSTDLAAMEGTSILIGRDCLFSGGVHLRTGDSHSLLDLERHRINPSQSIVVADHVWIGANVTVLKGVRLPESSVIGSGSVVTRSFDEPHCVIAGNPAKVVRRGVDWQRERIPCD